MATTKQQAAEAARKRFKTKDVDLGGGVTVTLRELSGPDKTALDHRLWQVGTDGELAVEVKGGKDLLVPVKGAHHAEEWLAATMTPAFAVDELLGPDWPDSVKAELVRAAKELNGFTFADAVGNS
jgi:hypothetical protein